ncbi:hypothetical protein Cgig2_003402 [Carnegiea gigantea]|uniref:Uncharacterized protein n=1 Tax=Carnegiea gigantea TaxID=171969 RepID=A0A9Q1K965_9CARY|nr:hypothetical protein Cgig2_003402 [Carnegiea gigantea]
MGKKAAPPKEVFIEHKRKKKWVDKDGFYGFMLYPRALGKIGERLLARRLRETGNVGADTRNSPLQAVLIRLHLADHEWDEIAQDLEHEVSSVEKWPCAESLAGHEGLNTVNCEQLGKIPYVEMATQGSSRDKLLTTSFGLETSSVTPNFIAMPKVEEANSKTSSVTTNLVAMPKVEEASKEVVRDDNSVMESDRSAYESIAQGRTIGFYNRRSVTYLIVQARRRDNISLEDQHLLGIKQVIEFTMTDSLSTVTMVDLVVSTKQTQHLGWMM